MLFNAAGAAGGSPRGVWTVIVIGAAVALGVLSILRHQDIAYVLAVVRVLTGIGVASNDLSTLGSRRLA